MLYTFIIIFSLEISLLENFTSQKQIKEHKLQSKKKNLVQTEPSGGLSFRQPCTSHKEQPAIYYHVSNAKIKLTRVRAMLAR